MITIKLCAFADEASSSIKGQIEALLRNNIHYVELRNINGKNIADFTDEEALMYCQEFNDAGIKVFSLGSPLGKVDIHSSKEELLNKTERLCQLAKIFKCENIRMFSFYNAYDESRLVIEYLNEIVKIGNKYVVNMCHENEKKVYGDVTSRVEEILESVNGLKQVYDPANYIQCQEDPNISLKALHKSAFYFHIKDALLADGSVVRAGHGDGKVKQLIEMINDDKTLTIEPHLKVFKGYSEIDSTELVNKEVYRTNDEAFDAACKATKDLLVECGYKEEGKVFVK